MDNNRFIYQAIAAILAILLALENPMYVFATSYDQSFINQTYEEPVLEEESEEISGTEDDDTEEPDEGEEDNPEETVSSDEVLSGPYDDLSYTPAVSGNTVVKEIVSLRDEHVKAYSMADHSIKVCYYPEPVNYMDEDGRWETIKNPNVKRNFHDFIQGDDLDYRGLLEELELFENVNGKKSWKY